MSMRARVAVLLLLLGLAAASARAEPPAPAIVTPELVDAARREGKVTYYTAIDARVAGLLQKAFEAKYPGMTVDALRSGAERNFQRIAQEYASGIHVVDVVDSPNGSHFLDWKSRGMLAPYLPADVARWPAAQRDPDGLYATVRADLLVMAYNTTLVKPEDAPKSFADMLDPKWDNEIVKAHPAYSGSVMTATFALSRMFGWGYFEKLGKQHVLQVQSSTEPPKKLALGERAVMADGNEYNLLLLKDAGNPVEPVYPTEGTPLIVGPAALLKSAPNPNAAKLFLNYLYSAEAQQFMVDVGDLRSFHKQVKEKPGHKPMREIKLMKDDPEAVVNQVEEIKSRYAKYFGT